MLQELDQNQAMGEVGKERLFIHRANVFHPKTPTITHMAARPGEFLAVVKDYSSMGETDQALSIIEVYTLAHKKFAPRLLHTIVNYETVTGIAWVSSRSLLTVTREQTINLWALRDGAKYFSVMTDYGPISCMRFCEKHSLLITGTDYGYAAVYKLLPYASGIEFLDKMVKISSSIQDIDVGFVVQGKLPTFELLAPVIQPPVVEPGKRKRNNDSDESDDQGEAEEKKFLDSMEVTIYGATLNEVVVWDYHKRCILETIRVGDDSCKVLTISVLIDNDILVGDSKGQLSLFSNHTFTCRQTLKALESDVLCIAVNHQQDTILVSGKDPTILTLKRQEIIGDEFVLFERIETHIHDVKCMIFTGKTEFYSGGVDGLLSKCKFDEERRRLKKSITIPNYRDQIQFSKGEMMIQYDRSLVLWKLPKYDPMEDGDEPDPVKSLSFKAKTYIRSATFSDKWICYSTEKDVHIFNRQEENLTPRQPAKKLPNCNLLMLCHNNRYLVACAGVDLYVVDLESSLVTSKGSKESSKFNVVAKTKLRSIIKHAINFDSKNLLVVGCGPPKCGITTFAFDLKGKNILRKLLQTSLQENEISFLCSNTAIEDDASIYIYTGKDQIFRMDASERNEANIKFGKCESIKGLPSDVDILGMICISKDHCILYGNHQMLKVDMRSNEVVNQSKDYNHIIRMDNYVFGKADYIALVELTPDDYRSAMPNVRSIKKFGH